MADYAKRQLKALDRIAKKIADAERSEERRVGKECM